MENILLKNTILVKSRDESNVLVLDLERDHVIELSGDVAKLMMILYNSGLNNKIITKELAQKELEALSPRFQKSEHKEDSINEALHYFKAQNLLNISE